MIIDFLSGCDGDFLQKLEEELAFVDNTNDSGFLSIDTKFKPDIASPQVSPSYNTSGNPLVSQYTHRPSVTQQPSPPLKRAPVRASYIKEDPYNLQTDLKSVPLPDVTQHSHTQLPSKQQQPIAVQQVVQRVVQTPVFVNLGSGGLQQIPDNRPSVVQLDGTAQINNGKPPNQPLLIQNNAKGVPFLLKTSDANFSPVLLQSNIINPDNQTLMYTSAPIQGKFF